VEACPQRSRGRSELSRDGGAPAGEEERDQVQEVQGGEEELAVGSFGPEGGRMGELSVEAVGGGAMGATVLVLTQGNSALGFRERRSREEKV
jgi:hypothetical protein